MCVPGASIIVAKQSWLSQSAALSATTVYTPENAGDYRVNIYIVASNNDIGATAYLTWTDEFRNNANEGGDSTGGGSFGQSTKVIHSAAGEPIQVSTDFSGSGGTYDLYVTVVQE